MSFTQTWGTAFNALASGALGANSSTTFNIDASTANEARVMIENTPNASVSVTRGVAVECYMQRGPTGSGVYETIPSVSGLMPSGVASVAERKTFKLACGKWQIKLTNLDVSNAITVGATLDTVS